ncbi:patatin-like protein [Gordonia sp. ABSL1-1]|uniref:patatin-like protein n=1 Tax=Gordonia sp. ABSL1-1 TaxID=3053923 RepID=UPI002572552E|nr:patatin-like protein [Gordonia sp. ABSL1-1]MDL9935768.1 patatin-like protein [Gordonia sp. ABSL1-1]
MRLALVCYGGVSLAVYMHGVTKELHKLVQASRTFDAAGQDPAASNPFEPDDSAGVYFELLRDLSERGIPMSVNIDIIGGTSAGGINGVVLAKALALDAGQESLKDVWINQGSLRKLLRAPAFLPLGLQAIVATATRALGFGGKHSILRSERMSVLLRDALNDMDNSRNPGPAPTLIPPGGNLSLFVTTTDRGGFDVTVPTGFGGIAQRDKCYAQVLQFHADHTDHSHFDADFNHTLAFAARATSSFPAAFDPVTIARFRSETGSSDAHVESGAFRFNYPENGSAPDQRTFVDGGLLDNAPFDLVIDAIAKRPAARRVQRELIYIEPDPNRPIDDMSVSQPSKADGFFRNLIALKSPATSHSFVGDLIRLRDLNRRIVEVGSITDLQMEEISTDIMNRIDTLAGPGADELGFIEKLMDIGMAQSLSDQLHKANEDEMAATWRTYQRLKALSVARRIATAMVDYLKLPHESSTATFVTGVLTGWVEQQPFFTATGDDPADVADLGEFLQIIDTPYRERRLEFIIAGINSLYTTDAPTAALNALKKQAWQMRADTGQAPDRAVAMLADTELMRCLTTFVNGLQLGTVASLPLGSPADWAADQASVVADFVAAYRQAVAGLIGDGSSALWSAFVESIASAAAAGAPLGDDHLVVLASRYLGFPRWDAILYPLMSLSELPQLSPIPVSQFSPIAADALAPPEVDKTTDPEGAKLREQFFDSKLNGFGMAHFAAFLKTSYRQNDYLWGRLDGAELIISMLTRRAGQQRSTTDGYLGDAFRAVLESEDALTEITDLRAELNARVEARWPKSD